MTPQSRDGICRRIDLSLRRLSSSIQTVTVGFGVAPNLPCGSWAITTGRDLHPALKILIRLFCGVFPDMPCRSSTQFLQTLAKETPRTPGSGRDNGAQKPLRSKKLRNERSFQSSHPTRKRIHSSLRVQSSFIQTILSASESHRIMPCGSWAIPPVGNRTLP